MASLSSDLRGHGESEGRQEDLALSAVFNDIGLRTSFSGGIAADFAAHRPDELVRPVLCNPLLNYKKHFTDDKQYWSDDQISWPAEGELVEVEGAQHGFAVDNDPTYADPQSRSYQDFVIGTVASWLVSEHVA